MKANDCARTVERRQFTRERTILLASSLLYLLSMSSSVATSAEAHGSLVERLSVASVRKHFDAYQDIDWESAEMAIYSDDPRWERTALDPLGATDWYQSLPQPVRARLGLELTATQMKIGAAFESVLCRGLLEHASTLDNRAPEYRYIMHELIEESQHQLMFQEFVNRSGTSPAGLTGFDAWSARFVPALGRTFPELFFFFVLGGEAPIDADQRRALESGEARHPLLLRIMQIHVTEEARHLCFAKSYLQSRSDRLHGFRRLHLQVRVPIILRLMAAQMLRPSRTVVRDYDIPKDVLKEAYLENDAHWSQMIAGLSSVADLCRDMRLLTSRTEPLWRRLGILKPHRL